MRVFNNTALFICHVTKMEDEMISSIYYMTFVIAKKRSRQPRSCWIRNGVTEATVTWDTYCLNDVPSTYRKCCQLAPEDFEQTVRTRSTDHYQWTSNKLARRRQSRGVFCSDISGHNLYPGYTHLL